MKPPDSAMAAFLAGEGSTMRTIGSDKARAFVGRLPRHCTWCGDPVPKGRRSWCGDSSCLAQWEERTNTRYQLDLVRRRDRGRCALCRLDTGRIESLLIKLHSRQWRTLHHYVRFERIVKVYKERLGAAWPRRALWEADHIVPVCEGGGLCTIDNLRTLCLPCHKGQTKALRKRRKKNLLDRP